MENFENILAIILIIGVGLFFLITAKWDKEKKNGVETSPKGCINTLGTIIFVVIWIIIILFFIIDGVTIWKNIW